MASKKSSAKAKAPAPPRAPLKKPDPALLGHDDVAERFRGLLQKTRLGHAYLFVGPEGIGKRRFARHLAQGLLCETNPAEQLNPCGTCPSCAQIQASAHPDLLEIARPADKNDLPIAVIQELIEQLALKPARGKRKIAIVDDADDLNDESANAFLKTLEEPPAGSVLLLIARSQETQLATIQSRCQIVRFRELRAAEVAKILLDLEITTNPSEAERLALLGNGSVARALELAKPEWRQMDEYLRRELARHPLSTVELAEKINAFIEEAGKESAPKRARARQVVGRVADLYREMLHAAVDDTITSDLATVGRTLGPDLLGDLMDRTLDADYHIARMAGLPLAVETWLDDLGRITSGRYLAPIR